MYEKSFWKFEDTLNPLSLVPHLHLNDPRVLVHSALGSQVWVPIRHSSTSTHSSPLPVKPVLHSQLKFKIGVPIFIKDQFWFHLKISRISNEFSTLSQRTGQMENRNNTRVSEKFKILNIKNIQTIVPKSLKSYSVT